jgi:hypothetical protein
MYEGHYSAGFQTIVHSILKEQCLQYYSAIIKIPLYINYSTFSPFYSRDTIQLSKLRNCSFCQCFFNNAHSLLEKTLLYFVISRNYCSILMENNIVTMRTKQLFVCL